MLSKSKERGDTLVEVMLAVVVLSVVTLGGLAIMNKGIAYSLGVLERTEVRARVNQQIEILSYVRDQHAARTFDGSGASTFPASVLWDDIRTRSQQDAARAADSTAPNNCTKVNTGSFYFREKADKTYEVVTMPATRFLPASNPTPSAGDGLWVEPVMSPDDPNSIGFIDFYVKACWKGIVGGQTESISSTVRLYDR